MRHLSQEKIRETPDWIYANVPSVVFVTRSAPRLTFAFRSSGAPVLRRGMALCQVMDYQSVSTGPMAKDATSRYEGRVLFQKFTSTEGWIVSAQECRSIVEKCFPRGRLNPKMTVAGSGMNAMDLRFMTSFIMFCQRAAEGEGFVVTSSKIKEEKKSRSSSPVHDGGTKVPVPFDLMGERMDWVRGTFADVPIGDLFTTRMDVDGREKTSSYRKVSDVKALSLTSNKHVELSPDREADYRRRLPKPGIHLSWGPFSGVGEGHTFVDSSATRWHRGQGSFAWYVDRKSVRTTRVFKDDEIVLYWQEEGKK